jgi:hypothetical protein
VLAIVGVASSAVLVAACGATDRLHDVQKVGSAVKYGTQIVQPMSDYAEATSDLQSDQNVAQNPVGRASGVAYDTAAQRIAAVAADLTKVDPPKRFATSHRQLTAGIRATSRSLARMAAAAKANRPKAMQLAAKQYLAAQRQVEHAFETMADELDIDIDPPPDPAIPGQPPAPPAR